MDVYLHPFNLPYLLLQCTHSILRIRNSCTLFHKVIVLRLLKLLIVQSSYFQIVLFNNLFASANLASQTRYLRQILRFIHNILTLTCNRFSYLFKKVHSLSSYSSIFPTLFYIFLCIKTVRLRFLRGYLAHNFGRTADCQ